jgi:hypothetical protein
MKKLEFNQLIDLQGGGSCEDFSNTMGYLLMYNFKQFLAICSLLTQGYTLCEN